MKGSLDPAVIRRLQDAAADRVRAEAAAQDRVGAPPLDSLQREILAGHAIGEELTRLNRERLAAGDGVLDCEVTSGYEAAVIAEMFEEGAALELWLAERSWDELDANGCDMVWVSYADGRKEQVEPLWSSDEEMLAYMQTVARRGSGTSEYRFDADAYDLSLELEDGSRLYALWGGRGQRGVATRPGLCIRRHRLRDFRIDDLVRLRSATVEVGELIKAAVAARLNIAFAAQTNAGKTTWLRAAAHQVPATERIISVEKTKELFLAESGHLDVMELESREANTEGRGAVAVADLVKASLRMNPARVLLGEILGPADVTALLNVMSQGNAGSMCTLHANNSLAVFPRLISLCLQSPERLTAEASGATIASAINLVVYITAERQPGGGLRRFVSSVREVGGWDGTQILSSEIASAGSDGLAVASGALTGSTAEALAAVGYSHRAVW